MNSDEQELFDIGIWNVREAHKTTNDLAAQSYSQVASAAALLLQASLSSR